MKVVNRKKERDTYVEELDIIESSGGYFYQIHRLEENKYVIICINDSVRGVIGAEAELKSVSEAFNYIETIVTDIEDIHKHDNTQLVLEDLCNDNSK